MSKNTDMVRRRLINKFPATQEGTWWIRGEDPNCDWGGPHSQPNLGYYTGRYVDIVDLALTMPGFWTWGGGGSISEVKTKAVSPDTARQIAEITAELDAVNKQKDELEKALEWTKLGGGK